jgi:hypothetical protein
MRFVIQREVKYTVRNDFIDGKLRSEEVKDGEIYPRLPGVARETAYRI